MKSHSLSHMLFLVITLALMCCAGTNASETVIRVNEAKDANGNYAMSMIDLALSKIEQRKYKIEKFEGELTQSRAVTELEDGHLDLMWAATNAELESRILPIRVPLYRSLLGYRVFIIHPDSQPDFDKVRTFDDLKKFTFGQGTTWADSGILESNDLTVVKANKYESLFFMCDGKRFTAFPRGVQEPIGEIAKRPQLNLTIEKRIMLVYKMPFYIFTNKSNVQLAADIEQGLNKAIDDGSFDKLFYSDKSISSVLDSLNIDDRLVFELNNPTLPRNAPAVRPELDLDIKAIQEQYQAFKKYN